MTKPLTLHTPVQTSSAFAMNTPGTEPVIAQPIVDHSSSPREHHSQESQSDQDELMENHSQQHQSDQDEASEDIITQPSRLEQVPFVHLRSQPGNLVLYTAQAYQDTPLVIPPVDRSFAVD